MSWTNTAHRPRPFLLYELMATDAWPLLSVTDDEFDTRIVCGEKTYAPRMEAVPGEAAAAARRQPGLIYENYVSIKNHYFTATLVAN